MTAENTTHICREETHEELGQWLQDQRDEYDAGTLEVWKIKKLDALAKEFGDPWHPNRPLVD